MAFTLYRSRPFTQSLAKLVINRYHQVAMQSTYTPRRAFLYVPASDMKKIKKVESLDVDCVVMDCEDAVAVNAKDIARKNVLEALQTLTLQPRTESSVRINSFSSGFGKDDLKTVLSSQRLPNMINLPKVESPEEMEKFAEEFKKNLGDRKLEKKIALTIMIETALGFTFMREICKKGCELSEKEQFNLEGVVFGTDDFAADIGAERTPDLTELMAARQLFVITSKAFGLQPIDSVYTAFKDVDGLRKQAEEGRRLGYLGKQVIHPMQVPVVQEAFLPNKEKIKWAIDLIDAFDTHQKSGKGAFTFNGKMIDMPVYIQAKNIVHLVNSTKKPT
ncbi:citramalyl-CoA lyase, mitochondrial-like isoform X2 [Tubulanus polymorphus]